MTVVAEHDGFTSHRIEGLDMTPIRTGEPIDRSPTATGCSSAHTRISIVVDPGAPVFTGHYPGFPILPGACILEYAHRSALAATPGPDKRLELVGIDSARFLGPVFPGDQLAIEIDGRRDGEYWQCTALVSTDRGRSAHIRFRYAVRRAP